MKITKSQLKQIIKEEISKVLNEDEQKNLQMNKLVSALKNTRLRPEQVDGAELETLMAKTNAAAKGFSRVDFYNAALMAGIIDDDDYLASSFLDPSDSIGAERKRRFQGEELLKKQFEATTGRKFDNFMYAYHIFGDEEAISAKTSSAVHGHEFLKRGRIDKLSRKDKDLYRSLRNPILIVRDSEVTQIPDDIYVQGVLLPDEDDYKDKVEVMDLDKIIDDAIEGILK
tara:strand:+ start:1089 stop:1772 length:684 start_codon:yes stop_codon:yes gene_type:complete